MANVLNTDKQIAIIAALTEGSSIRSIERITGVHRDTIMRLGVKVGQGCTALMNEKMRDLPCTRLEMDEIWGFVGKKERHVKPEDEGVGSVWTFCAIDADTKLVPAFRVGDRDAATANAFVKDIASRMRTRVQISTDGLNAYVNAVESAFGGNADYGQIIKTYGSETSSKNRRYSQPDFVSSEKKIIAGRPNMDLISTSYVERLNATTRLHMRRLTRLTLAFSKKRENFEAAVGLHFAYYNFVKRHNTLRCTPAMAGWRHGIILERRRPTGGRRVSNIAELRDIIHRLHGAEATHRESVPVKETFKGETVWEGIVEVFDLAGHPKASRVYAWKNEPDHHVTVLHLGPIKSAADAVKAAIVQEFRSLEASEEA